MKYCKTFEKHIDYELALEDGLTYPNVSCCEREEETHFNVDFSSMYLTFKTLGPTTFSFSTAGLSYSLNGGEWTELAANTPTPEIPACQSIRWKGNLTPSGNGIGTFSSTDQFSVEGNVMSLLYGDNFAGEVSLSGKNQVFKSLFQDNENVTYAHNLILPATTLSTQCYGMMFLDCTSLVTPPLLPATSLTAGCYRYMFSGCTSLAVAPELPAQSLTNASLCYSYMFSDCESLTKAPELPATTLNTNCYSYMFRSCISLVKAPDLPATNLAENCYQGMFSYCTSLSYAPTLPATTLATYCYLQMFSGCTSLTTAPELPATTLADSCYNSMFYGCTALTTVPAELPATTLAESCYTHMFHGCTSLTEAPELPATTLAYGCYQGMFWGTGLATAPELPATTLANICYSSMFRECLSLTEAPELPAMELTQSCYSFMFYSCISLTEAPDLPAITLVQDCYVSMYYNCTNLNYIKAMYTTTPTIYSDSPTATMLGNVASTGTFVKNANATWNVLGPNAVPLNWSIELSYEYNYLTFTPTANATFQVTKDGLSYSIDDGSWTALTADTDTPTVQSGHKIRWKGEMTPASTTGIGTFSSSAPYNAVGNPMCLLFGDDYIGKKDLTDYPAVFRSLFSGSDNLVNARYMELPARTLSARCYREMFIDCISLTNTPKLLPSRKLTTMCYYQMFSGCESLTTVPKLPAKKVESGSYSAMFENCITLTTPPELPATTLESLCYSSMFSGCNMLATAPELPATTLAPSCYSNMFTLCESLTVAPELPATELATECYANMFLSCTGLTVTPDLPATTLALGCYQAMFASCDNLTTCTGLPALTLVANCYDSMFALCKNFNYIKAMFINFYNNTAGSGTLTWLSGTASTGTFVKNAAAQWDLTGLSGIPEGWTVQTETA